MTSRREIADEHVGYLSSMSVQAGDPLRVHVATRGAVADPFVDVYRVVGSRQGTFEPQLSFVTRGPSIAPRRYAAASSGTERMGPPNADVDGCGWPAVDALTVPADWPSGLYLAQFTGAERPSGKVSERVGQDALFVVRRPRDDPGSTILLQLGVATWNAYHVWHNRNLYIGDVGDPTGDMAPRLRAHRVSFHRPGIGLAPRSNIHVFPPTACMYVPPFLQWAAEEGIELDCCAGTDLHHGLVDLDRYRLLVTVGHDEYWSKRQRDRVEAFVAGGGNAAFFGGNLAYWQIRIPDDGSAVECHKRAPDPFLPNGHRGEPLDPGYRDPELYPEHDNSEVTVEWFSAPLHRSTTSLTGVSMRNDDGGPSLASGDEPVHCGATWWWENFGGPERPREGFTVLEPDHWAFEGTELAAGDVFGAEQKIIGFECDGLDVAFADGRPVPTHRDGAPQDIRILAYADCRSWSEVDYSVEPPVRVAGRRLSKASFGGVVTMVCFRHPDGGEVFTAPVTDWSHALVDLVDYTDYRAAQRRPVAASPTARAITGNVLRRLARDDRSTDGPRLHADPLTGTIAP